MWSLIKAVLIRIAAARLFFRLFGGLLLVPLAFLLKVIGLPLLIILGIMAVPVLLVLFVLGLPIFMVLIVGGAILALLSTVLTVGGTALKLVLLIGVPLWIAWMLASFVHDRVWRRNPPPATGESTL